MENVHTTVAAAHHDEGHSFSTKAIWRTFWVLLVITLVELGLAVLYYETSFPPKHVLNGVYVILTLSKAFFIVAEFMHLKYELKNLIMTVAVPIMLFIWMILAFLYDGNSYKELRNSYNPYHKEQNEKKIEKKPEHGAQKPGAVD